MYGLDWNDPLRIRSWQELVNWINEIGFLPLFRNEIEGFSAEEHTADIKYCSTYITSNAKKGSQQRQNWEKSKCQ